jgi:hypothetical protein
MPMHMHRPSSLRGLTLFELRVVMMMMIIAGGPASDVVPRFFDQIGQIGLIGQLGKSQAQAVRAPQFDAFDKATAR